MDIKVKFNNYAIEQITNVKRNTDSIFANITAVVWGGYLGYCFAQQIEPAYTFEQVSDWVDEGDEGAIEAIAKQFESSKQYQKLISGDQQKKSTNNPIQ